MIVMGMSLVLGVKSHLMPRQLRGLSEVNHMGHSVTESSGTLLVNWAGDVL